MGNYTELKARLEGLQHEIESARRSEAKAVIENIRSQILEYGLRPEDVFEGGWVVGPVRSRRPVKPKYMDPKTGATWSGRGRAPRWIADVQDRSAYLLEKYES